MSEQRKRYNIGAYKLPYEERDIAHSVITEDDDHGFYDIIGADCPDHDETHYIGSEVTYTVKLTSVEANMFRRASNVRYVEEDIELFPTDIEDVTYPDPDEPLTPAGTLPDIPMAASRSFMEITATLGAQYHGRDVPVAIIDQGTTAAARNFMGVTLMGRKAFGEGSDPSPREVWPGNYHGALCLGCGVPPGGKLYDCLIAGSGRTAPTSNMAMAMKWAADQGCKIMSLSYGSAKAVYTTASSVFNDALRYIDARNAVIYIAAGNDNLYGIASPASASLAYNNCYSVIAFDQATGRKSTFSNYSEKATGCAPGTQVRGITLDGHIRLWDGTSAATPHAASLCARAATGQRFTPRLAAEALRTNMRNTGSRAADQGGGAFSLARAVAALTKGTVVAPAPIGNASSPFSATFTTTSPGSAVSWLSGDSYSANGVPSYLSSAVETWKVQTLDYAFYSAYQQAATPGVQTIGMSSPTGQRWSMIGIEIKMKTSADAAASEFSTQGADGGYFPEYLSDFDDPDDGYEGEDGSDNTDGDDVGDSSA